MKGYIKLPRDFLEWEWWGRWPHHLLFEWLLIKARIYDKKVQGVIVRRGSVLTTWRDIQEAVGCSTGTLSRALKDLSESQEIIIRTEQRKTLITICHYEDYQGDNSQLWSNSGATAEQQRSNTPIYKEERKNEKDIYSAHAHDDNGFVSDSDCRLWMQRYNAIAASFGAKPADQLNTKRRLLISQRVRERGRGSVDILFQQLEQSVYFFGDGSRGFRGDFTNLWTLDVYTKVCEGYYVPAAKKTEARPKPQRTQEDAGAHVYQEKQSREDYEQEMRRYAEEHPESRAAQVVARWNQG